ncbi:MAG: pyrroline-5-carboxylate reductase [Burkholderiales bacterium]|nr:pyrroline-5-carboxylate reductase [Burkholderiales bacterium]
MKVTFIGGGNMAAAMIGGMLARGFAAADIRAVDVAEAARERLAKDFGIATHATASGCADNSDVVVLAVKPQQMAGVAKQLRLLVGKQLVLTIAAGIRTSDLCRWLGGYRNIIRAMPNTPALVQAGITALYARAEVSQPSRAAAQSLLDAVGETVWLDDESQLDAVTALSGSGPAYVFYFLEALQEAGRSMGLSASVSRVLSLQTLLGAAKLAATGGEAPEVLRARVTSQGGTTERAINEMEANAVKQHMVSAILAAKARSHELGAEFGSVE